jgi:hypothetical protein
MQILFNELSLEGQFVDQDDFLRSGLRPFLGVLKEMQYFSMMLHKKSDVWDKKVTSTSTLYSLLKYSPPRKSDEIRRLKSAIADLAKEPFWDHDIKQDPSFTYILDGVDVRGSSPAEACERDQIVVSFVASSVSSDPLDIIRNGIKVSLLNLTCSGRLTEYCWVNNHISFESYLKTRFSGGKLDFSRVDEKLGFSKVQSAEHSLFIDTFRKFEELTWDQILMDKGLDYKEYHGTISARYQGLPTFKFRVSRRKRCHGYRDKNSFIVIGFETDHSLSDRG